MSDSNSNTASRIAHNTFRRMANQLGTAKIIVLEKIGKRDTTETFEMQQVAKSVEDTRMHLKDVYKKVLRMNRSSSANLDDVRAVGESCRLYSNSLANNGEHPTLAGMFLKLADFLQYHEDLKTKMDFLIGLQSENIKDFVKGDIREARMEKKRFDKVRQTYESSLEALKRAQQTKSKNLKEIEEEVKQLKVVYEGCTFTTFHSLNDVIKKNDFETLEKCCEIFDAYIDFFEKGNKYLSGLAPFLQKHKEVIQQTRKQFTEQQVIRSQSIDENGLIKPRVFGVPLEEITKRDGTLVPLVVSKSIDYLQQKGRIETEGIFRISGAKCQLDEMKRAFEEGKNPDFNKVDDPSVIAGILKLFFRELPIPLLTYDLYDKFLCACADEPQEMVEKIRPVLEQLPPANKEILRQLMGLCSQIVMQVEKNKMSASNLAIVLSPNLIHPRDENSILMKIDLEKCNMLVLTMITHYEELFSKLPVSVYNANAGSNNSAGGGVSPLTTSRRTFESYQIDSSSRGWSRGVKPADT